MKYLLVIIYLILSVSGLVFMKIGGNSGSLQIISGNINFSINWISLIGFACYLLSFFLFTRIVIIFDLSYIMPICTGIVQIATLISGKIIFKEVITIQGIIGASIVIIGIIIMNLPKTIST